MNKQELARLLARQSHRSCAQAADYVDALVHRLIKGSKHPPVAAVGGALGCGRSLDAQGQAVKRRLEGRALLRLVDRCLREGASIEIDGMGSFLLNAEERVVFEPNSRGRVFLAYAEEDRAEVRKL